MAVRIVSQLLAGRNIITPAKWEKYIKNSSITTEICQKNMTLAPHLSRSTEPTQIAQTSY